MDFRRKKTLKILFLSFVFGALSVAIVLITRYCLVVINNRPLRGKKGEKMKTKLETILIRKIPSLAEWQEAYAQITAVDSETATVAVIATIELDEAEFQSLCGDFISNRAWLEEYKEKTLCTEQGWQCLAVTSKTSDIAVLIACEGYGYPRYTAAIEKSVLTEEIKNG